MKLGTVKQKKKIFPGAMRSFSPIFTNRSIRKDGEKIFIHQFLIPDIYEGIEGESRETINITIVSFNIKSSVAERTKNMKCINRRMRKS